MYIQRFTKNTFYVEKNPTIVNFPIKSIEFGDFLTDDAKKKYPNGAPYDLIANIVHEGAPTSGTYKLHILHKGKIKTVFKFTIMCKTQFGRASVGYISLCSYISRLWKMV